jgi:HD-like signal output (HDOD) protein
MITASQFRAVLEQRLESENIPVLRPTSLRLVQLLGNPLTDINIITELILRDQGFTAQILKLANSAYFGRGTTITSLTKAVINIGYATLRDVALTVEYADLVQKRLPKRVQLRRVLAKALVTSRWASGLGQEIRLQSTESLFTSGLLESLGDLALAAHLSEVYQRIEVAAQAQGSSYQRAHVEVTDLPPHDVTTIVGWHYQIPENLILPFPSQQTIERWTSNKQPPGIVYAANELAYNLFSWPYPHILDDFNDVLLKVTTGLDLSPERVMDLLACEYQNAVKLGGTVGLDSSCFAFQDTVPEKSDRNQLLTRCKNAQSRDDT